MKDFALMMIGAALVKAGPAALVMSGISRVVLFIFIAPCVGLILGWLFGLAVY